MNYRKPYNGSKKRLSVIKRTVNLEEKETKKKMILGMKAILKAKENQINTIDFLNI